VFGISFSELVVIFLVVLVIFGPERLPQIASSLGKAFGEFNRKSNELKRELCEVIEVNVEQDGTKIGDRQLSKTVQTNSEQVKKVNE